MLAFEDTFDEIALTQPKRILVQPRYRDDDDEMGFLPLLAAAVPMVTSLAGSLLSKKDKSGGAPPEAAQAQGVLDILTKAMTGEDGEKATSIADIVKNVVSTVPSPVVNQVKKAINEMKNAEKASAASRGEIVKSVDAKFGPQITAMLAGLKAQQLQQQATYEHNVLKAQEAFKKGTTQTLSDIAKRLILIEQRLGASALVRGKPAIAIMGGNILR